MGLKLTDNMVTALMGAEYRDYDAKREGHTGWQIMTMDGRTRAAMHRRGLMHGHYYLTAEGVKVREGLLPSEPPAPIAPTTSECTCSKGAPSPGNKPCLHCGGDNSWCAKHYPAPQPSAETFAITVIRISGDEHVHRTGCGDIKRSKARAGIWADEPWDMMVASQLELAENVWSDVSTDAGPEGSPEWWDALNYNNSAMTFHACVPKLPRGEWQTGS